MKKKYFKYGVPAIILCLFFLISGAQNNSPEDHTIISHGAIIRGDTTLKNIALVFTADEFGDGATFITKALKNRKIQASFFFTGNFYRDPQYKSTIQTLKKNGHYLGSHSDRHLLYCSWENRDSLLVTREAFKSDLENAYAEMGKFGIRHKDAHFFLPPYEWYNDSIAGWTHEMSLKLVNFTPGTRSNADYTYPEMGSKYIGSNSLLQSILQYEKNSTSGLNGFILLIHFGTDPRRTDKFYLQLPELIKSLKNRGYNFLKINELLPPA